MMWNPPPALALYAPFALMPARWAALSWIALQLFCVMLACDYLWRVYAPGQSRWRAQLIALAFVGTWWVVAYGQNVGILALGLAGFVYNARQNRPLAAGMFAALTALKPHLLAGFGVILIADAFFRRGRVTLAAGTSVIALSLGFVLLTNQDALGQFLDVMRDPGPGAIPLRDWTLPVPSYWIRMALAPEQFWINSCRALACRDCLLGGFAKQTMGLVARCRSSLRCRLSPHRMAGGYSIYPYFSCR